MTYKVVPFRVDVLLFNKMFLAQRHIGPAVSEAVNQEQGPLGTEGGRLLELSRTGCGHPQLLGTQSVDAQISCLQLLRKQGLDVNKDRLRF